MRANRTFSALYGLHSLIGSQLRLGALWLILWSGIAWSGPPEKDLLRGIDLILNEQFSTALAHFDSLIVAYPDHPAGYFYKAMAYWRNYFVEREEPLDEKAIEDHLERAIRESKRMLSETRFDKNDPRKVEALFYLGGAYGYKGLVALDGDHWIQAARAGVKGWKYLRQVLEEDRYRWDAQYGLGLYNYMTARLPGVVRFVGKILTLPMGDQARGLAELRAAAERGRYSRAVAKSALATFYLRYERRPVEARQWLEELTTRYPNSVDFRVLLMDAYFQLSVGYGEDHWAEMLPLSDEIRRMLTTRSARLSPRWEDRNHFATGYAAYRVRAYDRADRELREYVARFDDRTGRWLSLAELTLGKIADLRGQRDEAIAWYRRAKTHRNIWAVHHESDRYLKHPFGTPP